MDLLVYPLYIVADRADHHARQLLSNRSIYLKTGFGPLHAPQQNQSGKSAGVAGQHLPEVRIHDHAESGQATGF